MPHLKKEGRNSSLASLHRNEKKDQVKTFGCFEIKTSALVIAEKSPDGKIITGDRSLGYEDIQKLTLFDQKN